MTPALSSPCLWTRMGYSLSLIKNDGLNPRRGQFFETSCMRGKEEKFTPKFILYFGARIRRAIFRFVFRLLPNDCELGKRRTRTRWEHDKNKTKNFRGLFSSPPAWRHNPYFCYYTRRHRRYNSDSPNINLHANDNQSLTHLYHDSTLACDFLTGAYNTETTPKTSLSLSTSLVSQGHSLTCKHFTVIG